MQLTFQEIQQIILNFSGEAVVAYESVDLNKDQLAGINDDTNVTHYYYGTLSGNVGTDSDILLLKKAPGQAALTEYEYTQAGQTNQDTICPLYVENVLFSEVHTLNGINYSYHFHGYHFIMCACESAKSFAEKRAELFAAKK